MGGGNDENSKIWEVGGQPRAAGELGRAPRAPRWQHRRFHLLFLPLFILSILFFAHLHPLSSFFSSLPVSTPLFAHFCPLYQFFWHVFIPFSPVSTVSIPFLFCPFSFSKSHFLLCPFLSSLSLSLPVFTLCIFFPSFFLPPISFFACFLPLSSLSLPIFYPISFFLIILSLFFSARFHSFCITRVMPSTISPPPSDSKHFWGLADPQPLTPSTDFSALCSPGAISCPEFGLILHCTQCSQLHFCDLSVPLRGCDSWMGLESFGGNHIHSFFAAVPLACGQFLH